MTTETPLPEGLSAVHAAIAGFNYPVLGGTEHDIRFQLRTRSGKQYRAQWLLNPEYHVARLVVHLDSRYSAERIRWIGECVHRLNCEIAVLGGFGLDWNSGGIFLRYGLDLNDEAPTPRRFRSAMNSTAYPISVFEACRPFIEIPGKYTAAEAVSAAMLITGSADDHAFITKAAKRLVIKLVK